jgi:hypothetical protein
VGRRPARRRRDVVRHRHSVPAVANHRRAGADVQCLCCCGWRVGNSGRDASVAARRALAIADPGGGDEPGSSGCRSRLAGDSDRCAVCSAGLRVGRGHRSTAARGSAPAFRPAWSLGPGSGGCGVGRLGGLGSSRGRQRSSRDKIMGMRSSLAECCWLSPANCENDTRKQLQLPPAARDHLTRSASFPIRPLRMGMSSPALRG